MLRLLTSTIFVASFCVGVLSTNRMCSTGRHSTKGAKGECPDMAKRCLNGGTPVSSEECACAPGWTGTICGKALCKPPCRNGGVCSRPNKCTCAPGWTGTICGRALCKPPCRNGGVCSRPNKCTCAKGWSGRTCNTPVCPRRCKNGGRCIFNPTVGASSCACVGPWRGDDCSMRIKICFCPGGEQCSNSKGPIRGRPMCCRTKHVHCFEDPNSAGGDPHFLIYLPDDSKLCFSVQGDHGFAFNLVTSKTLVINAVFIKPPPRLQQWASVMGEIGVLYMRKPGSTVRMHFKLRDRSVYISGYGVLDAKRVSSVILKGDHWQVTNRNTTLSWASTVFVSVGEELQFMVFYNHDNLDLVWSDVNKFNHSSHGILGQFFNKWTKVDKVNKLLVLPNRPPIPVTMETTKPEVHHKTECWRPVTPGYQGQGLLEGEYLDYVVDRVLATEYVYSLTSEYF